jgi:hypothetical protein
MSLADPAPALLALLTVVVLALHVGAAALAVYLVLRMLGLHARPGNEPGSDGGDDDRPDGPTSPPLPPCRGRTGTRTPRRPRVVRRSHRGNAPVA